MSYHGSWGDVMYGRQHIRPTWSVYGRVSVAGKLWGPALLLARTCSDKAFTETAAAMAEGSTTAGTPLHTLALLMSGKSDAVHAGHAEPAALSGAEQSSSPFAQAVQSRSAALLSQWQGNLAIMAANRVAGDEAAMVKLGDRLWRERSQVLCLQVLAGAVHLLLLQATVLPLQLPKEVFCQLAQLLPKYAGTLCSNKEFVLGICRVVISVLISSINQQSACQHLCAQASFLC